MLEEFRSCAALAIRDGSPPVGSSPSDSLVTFRGANTPCH